MVVMEGAGAGGVKNFVCDRKKLFTPKVKIFALE